MTAPAHMVLRASRDRGKVVATFEGRRALSEYVRSPDIPPEPKPLELPPLPKSPPAVFIVPLPNPVFCCCPKPRGCENWRIRSQTEGASQAGVAVLQGLESSASSTNDDETKREHSPTYLCLCCYLIQIPQTQCSDSDYCWARIRKTSSLI